MSMLDSFFSKGAFKGSKWYIIKFSDLSNWSIFLLLATVFVWISLISVDCYWNWSSVLLYGWMIFSLTWPTDSNIVFSWIRNDFSIVFGFWCILMLSNSWLQIVENSKTLLKLTIPRIKLLRNRREIHIKQMRRDIAKLLETGQEATARIRVFSLRIFIYWSLIFDLVVS